MEERAAKKLFYDKGFSTSSIVSQLKKLDIGKNKVYRTIKRLRETGSIYDRKRSGRPRSVRTPALRNKVKCRLWRNPKQSVNHMASNLGVSTRTLSRVVNKDLGLRAYKLRKLQGLSHSQIEKRLERSKVLLKRFAKKNWTKSSSLMKNYSAYSSTTIAKMIAYMQRQSKIYLKI